MDNKTSGTRKLFLKPASFQSNKSEQNGNSTENGSASSPVINNPFLKLEPEKDEPEKESADGSEKKDPAPQTTTTNLFQPANLFANAASSTLSENSNFVFGQNLLDRVVIEKNVSTTASEGSKDDDAPLFSSALSKSPETKEENAETESDAQTEAKEDEKKDEDSSEKISADKNLSLVEAARKYEEMRGAQKRKYEEVEITTGEEDERNVLEINCKLFTFIENNYEERGRGILRLNDSKNSSYSRVVFRASGSLRLLLNTKVWRDQVCEQPSQKSMRLTAFDTNGVIKIYLVMGRVEDISHLYRALSSRIRREKDRTPEPAEPEPSKPADSQDETEEPASKRVAATAE